MSRKLDEAAERADEENPEWTRAMFRKAKPASEVLPKLIGEKATAKLMRRKPGRPLSDDKRVVRSFRLPADVVEAYEATGTEWRQLVARTLRNNMPGRK